MSTAQASGRILPMVGQLHSSLAGIAYQRNDLDLAQQELTRALHWGERTGITDILFNAYDTEIKLLCVRGERERALARMEQIRAGSSGPDIGEAEKGAHSLKSSAANVGAHAVRGLAADIERAANEGDLNQVNELLASLEAAFADAIAALGAGSHAARRKTPVAQRHHHAILAAAADQRAAHAEGRARAHPGDLRRSSRADPRLGTDATCA